MSGRPFIMARLPRTPALSQNGMGFCLRAAASHCFTFVRSHARSIRAVKRHFSGKIALVTAAPRPGRATTGARQRKHRKRPKAFSAYCLSFTLRSRPAAGFCPASTAEQWNLIREPSAAIYSWIGENAPISPRPPATISRIESAIDASRNRRGAREI